MKLFLKRLWWALTRNRAVTRPDHADPRLRGRTYAIPFQEVWTAALELADGGLRRWHIISADDQEGLIRAEARSRVFRFVDDVDVVIELDENGQTRVDVSSASRTGWADVGTNARRVARFCRRLDAALGATPAHILAASPPARPASSRSPAG